MIVVIYSEHLQQKLYPQILKYTGEELFPQGVVLMLVRAIEDYAEGLPSMVKGLIYKKMPNYLAALIPDEEGLKQAMEMYNAAMGK